MSATPRCLSSLRTCIQNFAPSVSWNHIPSTSRSPSTVTPKREVAGPALHGAALADLQHQRVEEDHRVDVVQRPLLPLTHVLHDRVGDAADQVATDLDAVDLGQVRLDVARRQAARVEREDLVVEALETPLALPHDLRLEAALAIPRRLDPTGPCSVASVFAVEPLRVLPVPPGGSWCGS